jgi:hypothetical protein
MQADDDRTNAGLGRSSKTGRIPPWILALLLTGCPLDPLTFGGGGGGGGTTTTMTMIGCGPVDDPKDCDDGNPCTVDTCVEGVCSYEPAPEGTSCGDASACNGEETGDGKGVCVAGTPSMIDDGENCTLDLCDPETGEVTHPPSPACGSWEATPTDGAPIARTGHTAIWTGTEMIVWGGEVDTAVDPAGVTATGARYDPVAKKWTAMSTANAPPPRHSHTAVWTGSKMIVWGGFGDTALEQSGGVYDPAADAWTPTAGGGSPQGRVQHTAVWTGAEMIVWAGKSGNAVNSGARYDVTSDVWSALPQGPSSRFRHGAVWTGSHMIVWGGNDLFDWHDDGRFFEPATGWGAQTSATDAPRFREGHTTLWTGSQMVVWGGFDGGVNLNSGGALDPAGGSGGTWTAIAETGAPTARQKHVGVWAGSQMMVWGGCGDDSCNAPTPPFGDGGFWIPGAGGGSWMPLENGKVTTPRIDATGVWTGSHVIVWGGKAGLTGALLATGAQSMLAGQ